jgi:tRNA(Ile)-lysidine synthase
MAAACQAAGLAYLLTAHSRDDQAETVLMRLGRAAGAAGIAGIRPVRALTPAVTLARPALGWPRAHLRAALPTGWAPVDDPSNRDGRFARTAARELLAREPMLDPAALAAAAAHAAEAEAALAWAAERAWASRSVASADGWTLDPHGLPPELQRRLVVRLFAEAGHTPRGPDVQRVMARLHAGMVTTLGPLKLSVGEGRWRATRLGRDG